MKTKKLSPDAVLQEYVKPSVFQAFTLLSKEYQSVNLGQGFPNWGIPDFLGDSVSRVLQENISSPLTSYGCENLLRALEREYTESFKRPLSMHRNFIVSSGGQTLLGLICASLLENEEVIVIEPYFSFYEPVLRIHRSRIKTVQIKIDKHSGMLMNWNQLEAQLSENTRFLFINSPHNPTGKVYSLQEYQKLDSILQKYPQVKIVSDEVYEKAVFGDVNFVHLASVNNLFEKTLTVFSGGKTFSCTGWRIGWVVGPHDMICSLKQTQFATQNETTPLLQEAMALSMQEAYSPQGYKGFKHYYLYLKDLFRTNVTIMTRALQDAKKLKMVPFAPQGGYFLIADISESVSNMPVIYLYSKTRWEALGHLESLKLNTLQEYQYYAGNQIRNYY